MKVRFSLVVWLTTTAAAAAAPVAAQPVTRPVTDTTVAVAVRVAAPRDPSGVLDYRVHLAPGVRVVGDSSGSIHWAGRDSPTIPLALQIPGGWREGLMMAGALAVQWPEGTRDSLHIYATRGWAIALRPPLTPSARPREPDIVKDSSRTRSSATPARQSGLAKDLILELTEASRVVPPGGIMTLKYVLYSAEGEVERIRLRVDPPPGWKVLDAELVERERPLEAWEIITEVLRIATPPDAPVGQRQLLRLTAEVVGEPGVAEALTHVHILNGGGLRVGGAHLAGISSLTSRLDPSGLEGAHVAGMVDLSGQLGKQTYVSLSYRQGPQENQSNYRYYGEEKYFSSAIRHDGWNLEVGNQISSVGNVLTGPSVNGDGVALRRMNGRVIGEVVLAQPTTFSGEGAGHLWRGNVDIKTALGTIGFAASDFERPEGGYNTLPPVLDPTLDPDSLEALERERELSAASASNRVQGLGMEANLLLAQSHRLVLRGGTLRLENAQEEGMSAPSLEAQYSFSGRSVTMNTRWRQTPPSVQGVYIPGDELSVDGSLRLVGELRLVARAYQYENETLGESYRSETDGRSLGLRYAGGGWRVEVHGNRREAFSSTYSLRRTGQVSLGLPLGPISLSANTEMGEEENPKGIHPFRSYRGDLRWSGEPGFASLGVSSYESGGGQPRLRADLLASLMLGEFEFAGGVWATRGWTAGGEPGVWMNVGLPVTSEFTLLLGLEHAQQPHALDASPWGASLGLRKKLILPLPFLPDGSLAQEPARDFNPTGAR